MILDVDNVDGKLLTGLTANVDIITGRNSDVLRVPIASTRFLPRETDRGEMDESDQEAQSTGRRATVWVPQEDPYAPVRKSVTLGLQGENYVEIKDGVEEGATVLVRSREIEE